MKTEYEIQEWLSELIHEHAEETEQDIYVSTYAEAGVMTYNKGIVIDIGQDSYQLTIVKSGGM